MIVNQSGCVWVVRKGRGNEASLEKMKREKTEDYTDLKRESQ